MSDPFGIVHVAVLWMISGKDAPADEFRVALPSAKQCSFRFEQQHIKQEAHGPPKRRPLG